MKRWRKSFPQFKQEEFPVLYETKTGRYTVHDSYEVWRATLIHQERQEKIRIIETEIDRQWNPDKIRGVLKWT